MLTNKEKQYLIENVLQSLEESGKLISNIRSLPKLLKYLHRIKKIILT